MTSVFIFSALYWLTAIILGVSTFANKDCGKAAKAETYLDTAVELIGRSKDTFTEDEGDNCKCQQRPSDCTEVLRCGQNKSDVYKIWPRNRIIDGSIDVYCDMNTEGGGWTLIQRRGNYKRPSNFFSKNWQKYKTGFGDPRRDFWLGNDNIYAMTNQKKYYLQIELQDFEGNTSYALYDEFWIDNEFQNYTLHAQDYSGEAGDSMSNDHDGQMFSTQDRDNSKDNNCFGNFVGGWWFNSCSYVKSNLNGLYFDEIAIGTAAMKGIFWNTSKPLQTLQNTEMKIRPFEYNAYQLDMNIEAV